MSVAQKGQQQKSRVRPGWLAVIAIAAVAIVLPGSASAQGLFDFLFGGLRPPPTPAPPSGGYSNPPGATPGPREAAPSAPRSSGGGGSSVFCVRICDGRYFPLRVHAGSTPAQMCSAFCPASETKIYRGGNIEYAVGPDGTRYSTLKTAFAYREKLIPDCTCNGRDPFGLAKINVDTDPTLRQGDIIATTGGFMAFTGASKRGGSSEFTPIQDFRGLGANLRDKLTDTKVAPAVSVPPSGDAPASQPTPEPDAKPPVPGATDMGSPNQRAQSAR